MPNFSKCLMWIGYVRRGSLDLPQVNRDNRSDSLYLKLRCLFLFRTWDVASLIIRTGMRTRLWSVCYLYIAQGSCNTGKLHLICLHYIVTAWYTLRQLPVENERGSKMVATLVYQHFAMEYPVHTFPIYQSNHPIMHFLYFLAKNHFDLEWIDNFFCCSKNAVKASWFANQFHDHTKNQAMRKWIFFSKLISKKIDLDFLLHMY